MSTARKIDCRRCHNTTRHELVGAEALKLAGLFLSIIGAVVCCLPVVIPLMLVLAGVGFVSPHRCVACGRWTWRRGEEGIHIPDTEAREARGRYDVIRAVRAATVADERDLIKPLSRFVRAVHREGPLFRLYAYSPAHRLHPIRAWWWFGNVWKWVTTSAIQWNHGREPEYPTHQVVFFNLHRDAPGVVLKAKFVVAGTEATCPGLVVTLMMPADLPDREARLERLRTRLAKAFQPDGGHVDLLDWPLASPPG